MEVGTEGRTSARRGAEGRAEGRGDAKWRGLPPRSAELLRVLLGLERVQVRVDAAKRNQFVVRACTQMPTAMGNAT